MNTTYDVDTLFIIKKETNTKDTIDLNVILQEYGLFDGQLESLKIKKGEYFGFIKEEDVDILDLPLHEYLFNKISELEDEIVYRRARFSSATIKTEKARLNTELEQMEKDYYTIIDVATASAKNAIVDLFSKNIADPKNRTDLLTPIYTRRVSSVKTKNVNDFYKDLAKDESLLKDLVEAGIITVQC